MLVINVESVAGCLHSPRPINSGVRRMGVEFYMKWLKRLLGSSSASESITGTTRRVTVDNPLIIDSPRIGFLNLLGSTAETIIEEDKAAFGPLFTSLEQSEVNPPVCEVLMIYCNVQSDGSIAAYSGGLRDIIRDSNAPIVIVATENEGKNYTAAAKRTGYGQANLIMTLERNDAAFTNFFTELFRRMFKGQSMLLAWVELAPQISGAKHENCPATIFAAEISHIVFRCA
jgi:hypothetical protein